MIFMFGKKDLKYMEYNNTDSYNTKLVDELMISNMLGFLNNPNLAKMLDDEELKSILSVIKNHVVLKTELALKVQQEYLDSNGRSR